MVSSLWPLANSCCMASSLIGCPWLTACDPAACGYQPAGDGLDLTASACADRLQRNSTAHGLWTT